RDRTDGYSPRVIALVETFAAQAVIAIENARLFEQLQESNRQVTEALEQQTATADILRVIASSPTDLQRVLDAIAESARRLTDAGLANVQLPDAEGLRIVAYSGAPAHPSIGHVFPLDRGSVAGRTLLDGRQVYIHDL